MFGLSSDTYRTCEGEIKSTSRCAPGRCDREIVDLVSPKRTGGGKRGKDNALWNSTNATTPTVMIGSRTSRLCLEERLTECPNGSKRKHELGRVDRVERAAPCVRRRSGSQKA